MGEFQDGAQRACTMSDYYSMGIGQKILENVYLMNSKTFVFLCVNPSTYNIALHEKPSDLQVSHPFLCFSSVLLPPPGQRRPALHNVMSGP